MSIDLSNFSEADLKALKKKTEARLAYQTNSKDIEDNSNDLKVEISSSKDQAVRKRMVVSGKILLHKTNYEFLRFGVVPVKNAEEKGGDN